MSLNESIVEDAALEWSGEVGVEVGTGRIPRPVNRRRSGIRSEAETAEGIRFLRWCWRGACARRSGD